MFFGRFRSLEGQNIRDGTTGNLLGHRVEVWWQNSVVECQLQLCDPGMVERMKRTVENARPVVYRHGNRFRCNRESWSTSGTMV